ncbi:MAG: hypothetical protein AB7O52_19560 [Planctomycetota bacterium]
MKRTLNWFVPVLALATATGTAAYVAVAIARIGRRLDAIERRQHETVSPASVPSSTGPQVGAAIGGNDLGPEVLRLLSDINTRLVSVEHRESSDRNGTATPATPPAGMAAAFPFLDYEDLTVEEREQTVASDLFYRTPSGGLAVMRMPRNDVE